MTREELNQAFKEFFIGVDEALRGDWTQHDLYSPYVHGRAVGLSIKEWVNSRIGYMPKDMPIVEYVDDKVEKAIWKTEELLSLHESREH